MTGGHDDRYHDDDGAGAPFRAGQLHDGDPGDRYPDRPLDADQLTLADQADERLPWLESPEDDDDAADDASSGGRMLALIAGGTLALAAIVGGVWWASHRGAGSTQVADGSTIAAPAQPYKEAPADPGGKTFAGTGDSSFAVSEGQNRPARLDEGTAAVPPAAVAAAVTPAPPAPASPAAATGAAKPAASPAPAPAAAPAATGIGVQVGAFASRSAAEAAWTRLVGQTGPVLSGVKHRVVEGNADIGKVYRLQAVAADRAGATALCSRLKGEGVACQVK